MRMLTDDYETARTKCGWVKHRECDKLLYGKKFPVKLKCKVHKNCVKQSILGRSATWCLKESKMEICDGQKDP